MKKRDIVFAKYNGLCAYTGQPLESDWQIDHVKSKNNWKYFVAGECAKMQSYENREKRMKDVNNIDNLLPALRIVNHYKRAFDLEGFREYLLTFHLRLAKLPKTTNREKTKERIIYMNRIADLFGITVDKPFSGIFYFEQITE